MRQIKIDLRHQERMRIVQELYSWLFDRNQIVSEKTKIIIKSLKEIDKQIDIKSSKHQLFKIAKADLSVLRLAVWELMIERKQPPKVIINEAIELAKEFGGAKSPAFVNGILGKIYEEIYG